MEITLEKESKIAKLRVSLNEADYRPKVAEKVKEYSKKASIKGFRPGKVPTSLIDRMYGKSILVDEINNLVSHTVSDYIKSNKLNIVGEPLPAEENNKVDWENQKDFEFMFNIGLVPEFKLDLGNLKETRHLINVDDKILNETIENLKSQFGEMADVEKLEDAEDFIVGELKELNGGLVKDQSNFPLSRIKESERTKFIGKKAGDTVTFEIQEAFEDAAAIAVATGLSRDEAEAVSGNFELAINSIRRKKPAELNQEIFDKVFGKDGVKSEEEFKEKLKTTIQENYSKESDALLNRDIEAHLIKNTEIAIPAEFLKDWLYKSNEGKFSLEEIEKQFDRFSEDLKWNLIKNKIAEENEIKAEHNEILAKTKEYILQQFGNLPMTDEMDETLNKIADNYLKQDNGKAYMQTYESVLAEKTLAFLKTKVKIDEKNVSLDEFKKVAGVVE